MKTADPELMRAINRFHVMDAIRRFGPVSRVEISQRTELSPTTVSAITAALLDDRLITPLQVGAVRDAGRGRPRVMLQLNPEAAHVVGVKLAPDQIAVAVTNFCADILASLDTAHPHRPSDRLGHRRPRRGRGAPLRRRRRPRNGRDLWGLRRAAGRRRARRGRLPPEPGAAWSAMLRSAPTSARVSACRRRSTATSTWSPFPSIGSDRGAASTTSWSSTSREAWASGSSTMANCSAAPTG